MIIKMYNLNLYILCVCVCDKSYILYVKFLFYVLMYVCVAKEDSIKLTRTSKRQTLRAPQKRREKNAAFSFIKLSNAWKISQTFYEGTQQSPPR